MSPIMIMVTAMIMIPVMVAIIAAVIPISIPTIRGAGAEAQGRTGGEKQE